MKKSIRILIALALVASMALALVGCGDNNTNDPAKAAQGVDTENHVITVGNTAATTGAFASVGVPFNYAQEAYFWYFENHT